MNRRQKIIVSITGIFITITNCIFKNGASIRLGMGKTPELLSNENIVIKNSIFSGTYANWSHVQLANTKGTTTVTNNVIDGGRNTVQLGSIISGTTNIINNKLSNSSDAAFRFGTIGENVNINVTGNTISNAVKSSTGAIARIGNNSGIPASSTITFDNNTYDGALWTNTTWSNVTGEFGINKDGTKVES